MKNFNIRYRILSALIVIAMTFSSYPLTSFAEGTALAVDIHQNQLTGITKDGQGNPVSYQLGNAAVSGTSTGKVITISVDSGYFTMGNQTSPGSAALDGGLDSNNEYISTASSAGQYKYLTYSNAAGCTVDELQSFIRSLVFYPEGTEQTVTYGADYESMTAAVDGGTVPLMNNQITLSYYGGDYYGYVAAAVPIDWFSSYCMAKTMTYKGTKGYLLTIESQGEHNLVYNLNDNAYGWCGASRMVTAANAGLNPDTAAADNGVFSTSYTDTTTYSNWYWVCGPNAGTKFYNGAAYSANGPVSGVYSNWKPFTTEDPYNEPNNYGTNEGYMIYGFGADGTWNDYPYNHSATRGFYVEFSPNQETRDAQDSRTVKLHTVKYDLSNVTSTSAQSKVTDAADSNENYTTTLSPSADYQLLPADVSVTSGGTALPADSYSYDAASGLLTVFGSKITGDIIISAHAETTPVTAEGYTDIYDAEDHGITVAGTSEGDVLSYSTDNQNWNSEMPKFRDAGKYTVYVKAAAPGSTVERNVQADVTISKAPLELTAESAEKAYDGKALTQSDFRILSGKLMGEDKLTADVAGSITEPGSTANKIQTVKILAGQKDVTANYEITIKDGTLTVTAAGNVLTGDASRPGLYLIMAFSVLLIAVLNQKKRRQINGNSK